MVSHAGINNLQGDSVAIAVVMFTCIPQLASLQSLEVSESNPAD